MMDPTRMCDLADALTDGRLAYTDKGGILTTRTGTSVVVSKAEIDNAVIFAGRMQMIDIIGRVHTEVRRFNVRCKPTRAERRGGGAAT